MIYYILFTIFIAWATFVAYGINNLINNKLKYCKNLDTNIMDLHKPFQRTDYHLWDQLEMTLVGIFILPLRLLLLVVPTAIFVILIRIFYGNAKIEEANREYPPFKRHFIRLMCKYFSKVVVFGCGFYWIKRTQVRFDQFKKAASEAKQLSVEQDTEKSEKERASGKYAPIMISNHVSSLDIMYFCSTDVPSFLSKVEVSRYPLWGPASIAIQSIFVTRENTENRDETKNKILQRCNQIESGQQLPPIMIFPEGTTTNNKYIIGFKRGAFETFQPVKAFVLKYGQRKFLPALDSLGIAYVSLFMLCQLYNTLTVYEFETMYPKSKVEKIDENSWQDYARFLKLHMLECGQLQNSEAGYRHMRDYQDNYANKQAKQYKEQQDKKEN